MMTGSLWTARLFPVQQTIEQSFQATLQILQNIIQNKVYTKINYIFSNYSMREYIVRNYNSMHNQ